MRRLALYKEPTQIELAKVGPIEVDDQCERCNLHEKARTICMPAEGEPNGVLLVGEMPGKIDDQTGRPFTGYSGKYLRTQVKKWWKGPIAYDNGVRCFPRGKKVGPRHIRQCRPYGADVLDAVNPTRIICFGSVAIESVTGRRPPVMSVRKGYTFYHGPRGSIPVFFTTNPSHATSNRFHTKDFESDLKWALQCDPPEPDFDGVTNLVETTKHARIAAADLIGESWITYDVETSAPMHDPDFMIESLTFLGADAEECYTWTRKALRRKGPRKILKELLESGIPLATQNGKYDDRAVLLDLLAHVEAIYGDTRLEHKLLYPATRARLEVLAEFVGHGGHKDECHTKLSKICGELNYQAFPPSPFTPTGRPRKIRSPAFTVEDDVLDRVRAGTDTMAFAYRYLDDDTLHSYNAKDVWTTRSYMRVLKKKIHKKENRFALRMWREITHDANIAVRQIEHWGMGCDRDAVENLALFCDQQIDQARNTIVGVAGKDFNPNSPPQVRKLLFDDLGLKPWKQTNTGMWSTDKDVLEGLVDDHPVVEAIVKNRRFEKIQSNYARGMLAHLRDDGRFHASILLDGAESGRSSVHDPALQTIPTAHTPEGKMIRDCFIARDGWCLLELDQSQIELRVAGDLSNDRVLIDDYKKGIDIHMNNATTCASIVWGISPEEWVALSDEERDAYRTKIKRTTFGKLYGKGTWTMAKEWGVPRKEVEKVDSMIWGRYHVLNRWTKEQISRTKKLGYVSTWWNGHEGIRRPVPMIADGDDGRRKHGENQSVNTPIQGTAAHYTMASLYPLVQWILRKRLPVELVMTVHDSVIFELREDLLDRVVKMGRKIMTGWPTKNGVPLKVDAKVGKSWGSMVTI
ncbi:hypothetical protein LCGC14_0672930 [marine sediment metagenome]|uniref:DNA-directed DNA polymerase family A palm domain-containing protein n=1 Tax=marine sediment metagenome TaxID=412755 RepID=A0A0F9TYI0_9ZZZZ